MAPIYSIGTIAQWNPRALYKNNEFINFKSVTEMGMRNTIFDLNPFASDYIPMHEFIENKFINVETDALGYIKDPNPAWQSILKCGEFPCTAPNQVLFDFKKNSFKGIRPDWAKSSF